MRFVPDLARPRLRPALGALAVATWLALPSDSRGAPSAAPKVRLTAKTADAMLTQARDRVVAKAATDAEILDAALVVAQLTSGASRGAGQAALTAIATAATDGPTSDARGDVGLLARVLAGDEGTDAGVAAERKLGVATDVAVLGPFRDTGGGLRTQ